MTELGLQVETDPRNWYGIQTPEARARAQFAAEQRVRGLALQQGERQERMAQVAERERMAGLAIQRAMEVSQLDPENPMPFDSMVQDQVAKSDGKSGVTHLAYVNDQNAKVYNSMLNPEPSADTGPQFGLRAPAPQPSGLQVKPGSVIYFGIDSATKKLLPKAVATPEQVDAYLTRVFGTKTYKPGEVHVSPTGKIEGINIATAPGATTTIRAPREQATLTGADVWQSQGPDSMWLYNKHTGEQRIDWDAAARWAGVDPKRDAQKRDALKDLLNRIPGFFGASFDTLGNLVIPEGVENASVLSKAISDANRLAVSLFQENPDKPIYAHLSKLAPLVSAYQRGGIRGDFLTYLENTAREEPRKVDGKADSEDVARIALAKRYASLLRRFGGPEIGPDVPTEEAATTARGLLLQDLKGFMSSGSAATGLQQFAQ